MTAKESFDVDSGTISHRLEGNHLEFCKEGFLLETHFGLDRSDYDILAAFAAPPGFVQHTEGFSNTGSVPKEDLEVPFGSTGLFGLAFQQELFGCLPDDLAGQFALLRRR
jgi:hypothetical protein